MGVKRTIPSRPNDAGYHLIADGVMTGTATVTSDTFNLHNLDNVGLQISWTGSPTGSITINCSIDGETFYPLTFNPSITQPAGSAAGYLVDLNQVPFPYLRVSYTNASGSGVLNVYLSAKDVN